MVSELTDNAFYSHYNSSPALFLSRLYNRLQGKANVTKVII